MAAGHRIADLKDGYTIDQVQLFARALAWNRAKDQLDRAEAVALGIAEAFAPAENLLGRLRQALLNPGAKRPDRPVNISPETRKFFGGAPVKGK